MSSLHLKSLLSAVVFACLAGAETIKITATSNNQFSPSTVNATQGDVLEFHFESQNHSVVAGDFQFPCSPLQLGTGFFSGFVPSSNGEAGKVFRVTVNNTDPLPFYSSQGTECPGGMVGMINPNANNTLADYTHRAAALAAGVTPGRTPFGGELVDNNSSTSGSSNGSSNGSSGGQGSSSKASAGVSVAVSMASLVGAMGLAFYMA